MNAVYKAADMRAQLAFATIIDPKLASQMEFTGIGQLQFYIFYEMKAIATFDIDVRTKSAHYWMGKSMHSEIWDEGRQWNWIGRLKIEKEMQ